jgi:hypothetical protein
MEAGGLTAPQPERFRALVTVGQAAEEIVRVARPGSRPDHHGNACPQGPPALAAAERYGPGAPSGAHRGADGGVPPALPRG